MSIKDFIKEVRDYGIELTSKEVQAACNASLELKQTIDLNELGEAALLFGQIGKMREAEGLDITKFELLIDLCNYVEES